MELESQRIEIVTRKKEAENLMHDNSKKVNIYQKEFEVYQRAFVKAVSDLHNLDHRLSRARKGEDAEAAEDDENHPLWHEHESLSSDETDSDW